MRSWAEFFEEQGKEAEAEGVYNKRLATEGIPDQYKVRMKVRLDALKREAQTRGK
jgi:hypothetical protein